MSAPIPAIGASAVAVASSSATLLIVMPEHNLIRSLAVVGLICSITVLTDRRTDRRLDRIEAMTAHVAHTESDVLTVLRHRDGPPDTGDLGRLN